ncbi:hypothetical protein [Blastococcus sp. TML/M2B]|uniref:hypothetical protein n=1 Tax=Blastococcus sp. TML/M2B TaxID=2798727 RepID=UPI001F5B5CF3|nr:hypothetical protein [Blastococcus sp. TML/M2B]
MSAPPPASRRSRGDAQPPGQHSSASTGTPTASAVPAKPIARTAGSSAATTGSASASPAPTPAGTSSPSPTTKEKAPEMGCESADTTR